MGYTPARDARWVEIRTRYTIQIRVYFAYFVRRFSIRFRFQKYLLTRLGVRTSPLELLFFSSNISYKNYKMIWKSFERISQRVSPTFSILFTRSLQDFWNNGFLKYINTNLALIHEYCEKYRQCGAVTRCDQEVNGVWMWMYDVTKATEKLSTRRCSTLCTRKSRDVRTGPWRCLLNRATFPRGWKILPKSLFFHPYDDLYIESSGQRNDIRSIIRVNSWSIAIFFLVYNDS